CFSRSVGVTTPTAASFDDLIGTAEEREGKGGVERRRRLEIDDHFNIRGLLDRQICSALPLEDASRVKAEPSVCIPDTAAVTHQAAGCGKLPELVDRWQSLTKGERGQLGKPAVKKQVVADH